MVLAGIAVNLEMRGGGTKPPNKNNFESKDGAF